MSDQWLVGLEDKLLANACVSLFSTTETWVFRVAINSSSGGLTATGQRFTTFYMLAISVA